MGTGEGIVPGLSALREYGVLLVFAIGVLARAAAAAEGGRELVTVAGLAAASLVAAWLLVLQSDDPGDLLFVVGFAAFFRHRLLPHISVRGLLHLTLLAAYVGRIRGAGGWLLGALALPTLGLLYLALAPHRPARWARLSCYVWFQLLLVWLAWDQLSPNRLRDLVIATGFSPTLYVHALFAGAAFLYVSGSLLHLAMLVPLPPLRRTFWDDILLGDRGDSVATETGRFMSGRVWVDRVTTPTAWFWLTAHAAVLIVHSVPRVVRPELVVNASIIFVAWLVESTVPRRRPASVATRRPSA